MDLGKLIEYGGKWYIFVKAAAAIPIGSDLEWSNKQLLEVKVATLGAPIVGSAILCKVPQKAGDEFYMLITDW